MTTKSYFDMFPDSPEEAGIPGFKMNKPLSPSPVEGDVGLELEIEGRNLPQPTELPKGRCPVTGGTWTSHVDGSLRGEAYEYVFDRPCSIDHAETLVRELFEVFRTKGTELTLSNRCSTHVHLNVSDWRINLIVSFYALWAAIEPALISWCGVERKSNHFCLSLVDTSSAIEHLESFLKRGPGKTQWAQGLKYTALNPLHLFDFGSLEVRCGRASYSADEVVNWTRFLWALREMVREEFANPRDVCERVSYDGPENLILRIGERAGNVAFAEAILNAAPTAAAEGRTSFREAQLLCYEFPWPEWLKEIEKPYVPNPFESSGKKSTLAGWDPPRTAFPRARFRDRPDHTDPIDELRRMTEEDTAVDEEN